MPSPLVFCISLSRALRIALTSVSTKRLAYWYCCSSVVLMPYCLAVVISSSAQSALSPTVRPMRCTLFHTVLVMSATAWNPFAMAVNREVLPMSSRLLESFSESEERSSTSSPVLLASMRSCSSRVSASRAARFIRWNSTLVSLMPFAVIAAMASLALFAALSCCCIWLERILDLCARYVSESPVALNCACASFSSWSRLFVAAFASFMAVLNGPTTALRLTLPCATISPPRCRAA